MAPPLRPPDLPSGLKSLFSQLWEMYRQSWVLDPLQECPWGEKRWPPFAGQGGSLVDMQYKDLTPLRQFRASLKGHPSLKTPSPWGWLSPLLWLLFSLSANPAFFPFLWVLIPRAFPNKLPESWVPSQNLFPGTQTSAMSFKKNEISDWWWIHECSINSYLLELEEFQRR